MQYKFFALISRMRYIARWGLMRNTFQPHGGRPCARAGAH